MIPHFCTFQNDPHEKSRLPSVICFSTGYRRDDEHCFERTPRAGETEYGKACPRRGAGYLRASEELSHPRRLHRIAQPFAQRRPQELRASDSSEHQLLQRHAQYFQACGGAQNGRAAEAPSPAAETCCPSKNEPGRGARPAFPRSSRQVLHNVTATGAWSSGVRITNRRRISDKSQRSITCVSHVLITGDLLAFLCSGM